jgi:hypothetical protein
VGGRRAAASAAGGSGARSSRRGAARATLEDDGFEVTPGRRTQEDELHAGEEVEEEDEGAAEEEEGQGAGKRAYLLHLDSMSGGHTTPAVADAIRSYLQLEWERKRHEGELAAGRASGGGAKAAQPAVAAAGGGDEGGATPAAAAAAAAAVAPSTVPYAWSLQHPGLGPVVVDKAVLPHKRLLSLPRQDNHCDCGLFLLTYLEFFVHAAPREGLDPAVFSQPSNGRRGKAGDAAGGRMGRGWVITIFSHP